MEHDIISSWCVRRGLELSPDKRDRLERYAGLLHEENRKHNLTGLKTVREILQSLVVDSLDPFCLKNVPRGTRILDLGTGGGVPGIPLGIYFDMSEALLVDSHQKKIDFVRQAIESLGLVNLKALCLRAEEAAGMPAYREGFDWVVTRAAGPLYVMLELSAPFARSGGLIYVYAKGNTAELTQGILGHAADLGLEAVPVNEYSAAGISGEGMAFIKTGVTKSLYPRRYAFIRRESEKMGL